MKTATPEQIYKAFAQADEAVRKITESLNKLESNSKLKPKGSKYHK